MQSASLSTHQRLADVQGVDRVLAALAAYKRKDPKDDDEQELMENLFDCLCSALNTPSIKEQFVESEGVELAVLMLKYVEQTKHLTHYM
jgi:beta-catenin-like protein 1